MNFEWDAAKSDTNRQSRGFGFDFAALIFAGPTIEVEDARFAYGEVRVKSIGSANGVVLVVIYTDRGEVRRIISARKADKREREAWKTNT